MRVLIVDNDSEMLEAVARRLREGFSIDVVTSKADALDLLRQNDLHVVVACERLSDGSGLDLLSQAAKRWPETLRLFAAAPDRLALLRGRLGPFKLFQTLTYPIDPGELGSILMLAQAAEAADADTANVQHIVLGDDSAAEEPAARPAAQPAISAAQATTGLAVSRGTARPMPFTVPAAGAPAVTPAARATPASNPARSAPAASPAMSPARTSPSAPARPAMPAPSASPARAAPAPARAAPRERKPVTRESLSAAPTVPKQQPKPAAPRPASPRASMPNAADVLPALAQMRARLYAMPDGLRPKSWQLKAGAAAAVLVALVIAAVVAWPDGAERTEAPAAETQPPADDAAAVVRELEAALTADDARRARRALQRLRKVAPRHERLEFFEAVVGRRGAGGGAKSRRSDAPTASETLATHVTAPALDDAAIDAPLAADEPSSLDGEASESTALEPSSVVPGADAPSPPPEAAAETPASAFAGRTLESGPPAAAPKSEPRAGGAASKRSANAPITDLDDLPPVVREARLLKRVAPDYPADAAKKGTQGSVEVAFTVTAAGRVTDAVVVDAAPAGVFDRAALSAVRRWRYEPRIEDGTPVDWRTQVRIEFQLER